MATRTVMPVDMAGPRGGIGQSPQHGAPRGRGRDAGGRHGRGGGSTGRHYGITRGRGGHPSPAQGPLLTARHALAGVNMNGKAPSPAQWAPRPQQQQRWHMSPPQLPPCNSAPMMMSQQQPAFGNSAIGGQQVQYGGVQQLPDGSFVLPVSQQIVLTPQQMQQLQHTGQLPPFVMQRGLQPPAVQQQPRPYFIGQPSSPQSFQQQQQQQQLGQQRMARPPVQPPQPPHGPLPMYQSGL